MSSASQDFYSVEQVATHLHLHPRTVRNYVRTGQLKAVRLGKQYRIAREDLAALTGVDAAPVEPAAPVASARADASAIVDLEPMTAEAASRLTGALLAAAKGPPEEQPLRVDTIYDRSAARLKVVITGSLASTAALLRFLAAYAEAHP
ncbi:MAG: helix-turn-helix domain-containing protein [Vicinamibacterales bacterium]